MISIKTQNNALVNIDNYKSIHIHVEQQQVDENDIRNIVEIVLDNTYILGYYNSVDDALIVLDYISDSIADAKTNTVIVMPQLSDLIPPQEEVKDDNEGNVQEVSEPTN